MYVWSCRNLEGFQNKSHMSNKACTDFCESLSRQQSWPLIAGGRMRSCPIRCRKTNLAPSWVVTPRRLKCRGINQWPGRLTCSLKTTIIGLPVSDNLQHTRDKTIFQCKAIPNCHIVMVRAEHLTMISKIAEPLLVECSISV